ncbi:P450 monooxygenase [Colletotrichum tofieldiae]|nr:P450 monooxygenase [Colletotrichum tofieldiae]GKT74830.1 P450 monooxygenase [Colletotrichum tofieldiae]
MAAVRDSFLDLERHRLQLEDNIAKLQKALQHWQKWDAEYESLKEEIESVPQPASREDLARIRRDFEGEVVDKKEINDLFGRIDLKPAGQIVNLLSRRIDYVSKSIETLEKQLESAEQKHAAASVVSNPDVRDEDGLPITEIIEELDEEGNVVASRLQRPGDSSAQLKEILEKAGVKDIPAGKPREHGKNEAIVEDVTDEPAAEAPESSAPATLASAEPSTAVKEAEPEAKADGTIVVKKSVSFAEDTKPSTESQVSRAAQRVEEIMEVAKSQEELSRQPPVIPEDESEQDAFLRREMLKYGMEEVGAVVAELKLEEGSGDDDEDWEYEYSDLDEDDEEDKFGRSKTSVLDEGYHQRMLELEKRLGVKSRFTEKVEAEADESDDDQQGIGRIVVSHGDKGKAVEPPKPSPAPTSSILRTSSPSEADDSKKSVRFSQSLDIAPDAEVPAPVPAPVAPQPAPEPFVEPLSDIVERTGPAKQTEAKSSRKTSRFKKQKAAPTVVDDDFVPMGPRDVPSRFLDQDRPTAPTGPEGKTLADAVIEKETKPHDGDVYDDEFIDQDLADEYHRQRRNFIQKQGGFLQEDTSVVRPLDEADGGQRISKFKAARLSKQ